MSTAAQEQAASNPQGFSFKKHFKENWYKLFFPPFYIGDLLTEVSKKYIDENSNYRPIVNILQFFFRPVELQGEFDDAKGWEKTFFLVTSLALWAVVAFFAFPPLLGLYLPAVVALVVGIMYVAISYVLNQLIDYKKQSNVDVVISTAATEASPVSPGVPAQPSMNLQPSTQPPSSPQNNSGETPNPNQETTPVSQEISGGPDSKENSSTGSDNKSRGGSRTPTPPTSSRASSGSPSSFVSESDSTSRPSTPTQLDLSKKDERETKSEPEKKAEVDPSRPASSVEEREQEIIKLDPQLIGKTEPGMVAQKLNIGDFGLDELSSGPNTAPRKIGKFKRKNLDPKPEDKNLKGKKLKTNTSESKKESPDQPEAKQEPDVNPFALAAELVEKDKKNQEALDLVLIQEVEAAALKAKQAKAKLQREQEKEDTLLTLIRGNVDKLLEGNSITGQILSGMEPGSPQKLVLTAHGESGSDIVLNSPGEAKDYIDYLLTRNKAEKFKELSKNSDESRDEHKSKSNNKNKLNAWEKLHSFAGRPLETVVKVTPVSTSETPSTQPASSLAPESKPAAPEQKRQPLLTVFAKSGNGRFLKIMLGLDEISDDKKNAVEGFWKRVQEATPTDTVILEKSKSSPNRLIIRLKEEGAKKTKAALKLETKEDVAAFFKYILEQSKPENQSEKFKALVEEFEKAGYLFEIQKFGIDDLAFKNPPILSKAFLGKLENLNNIWKEELKSTTHPIDLERSRDIFNMVAKVKELIRKISDSESIDLEKPLENLQTKLNEIEKKAQKQIKMLSDKEATKALTSNGGPGFMSRRSSVDSAVTDQQVQTPDIGVAVS